MEVLANNTGEIWKRRKRVINWLLGAARTFSSAFHCSTLPDGCIRFYSARIGFDWFGLASCCLVLTGFAIHQSRFQMNSEWEKFLQDSFVALRDPLALNRPRSQSEPFLGFSRINWGSLISRGDFKMAFWIRRVWSCRIARDSFRRLFQVHSVTLIWKMKAGDWRRLSGGFFRDSFKILSRFSPVFQSSWTKEVEESDEISIEAVQLEMNLVVWAD